MSRAGAALVLAVLVLLVLEGVVLGTVYLAVQERRIADNGVTALRLRLAAEGAARAAAAGWPAVLDSLLPGELSAPVVASGAGGLVLRTAYHRLDSALVLVFAEAAEAPPRAGRARATLLVQPPVLTERAIPRAALVAGATVTLAAPAVLVARAERSCSADAPAPPDALRLPAHHLLQRDAGSLLDGTVVAAALPPGWRALLDRIAAAPPPAGAADPAEDARVVAVAGDHVVRANTAFRGILLVGGALVVESGARVEGFVLAAGPVELLGTIRLSDCAAREAIRAARLDRPRPFPLRPSLPGF